MCQACLARSSGWMDAFSVKVYTPSAQSSGHRLRKARMFRYWVPHVPLRAPPLSERFALLPLDKCGGGEKRWGERCYSSLTCSALSWDPTENGILLLWFPSDNEVKESIFQKSFFFSIHGRVTSCKQQNKISLYYLSPHQREEEIIPIWLLYDS